MWICCKAQLLLFIVLPQKTIDFFIGFDELFCAEGDGSKIYVSCIAFRDPVSEDIAEAYRMPTNSFAEKCICVVSRSPCFRVLRDALEELFALCFSPSGSRWVSFVINTK